MTSTRTAMATTPRDNAYVAIVMTLLVSATTLALYDAYTFLTLLSG